MKNADHHPLKIGHEALHSTLKRAMREPGQTGAAARKLALIADGHFLREEKFVMPLLALLPALARGETGEALAGAPWAAVQLREQMEQMLADHREMEQALHALIEAAQAEGKEEYVAFAEEMALHAQIEESVLYPAALVTGEYVSLKRAEKR